MGSGGTVRQDAAKTNKQTNKWNASLLHRSAPRTIPSNNPEARGVTMRQMLGIGTRGALNSQ
ncbi:MAG: hypothetical protein C0516_11380 [Gemmatimonas sp.]|nr:hypothetical protein [Gemmatimonas sp.]